MNIFFSFLITSFKVINFLLFYCHSFSFAIYSSIPFRLSGISRQIKYHDRQIQDMQSIPFKKDSFLYDKFNKSNNHWQNLWNAISLSMIVVCQKQEATTKKRQILAKVSVRYPRCLFLNLLSSKHVLFFTCLFHSSHLSCFGSKLT